MDQVALFRKCPNQSPLCLKAEKSMWELAHHTCEGGSLTGSIVSDLFYTTPHLRGERCQLFDKPWNAVSKSTVSMSHSDPSRHQQGFKHQTWSSALRKINSFALLEASRFGIHDAFKSPRRMAVWHHALLGDVLTMFSRERSHSLMWIPELTGDTGRETERL